MAEKKTNDGVRIQKVMADNGVASRRKSEEMIEAGLVTVNGRKAILGQRVNPYRDLIAVDGQKLITNVKKHRYYIALNKPRGYVTTLNDEMDRKCVAELVENVPERVYPIGRLDRNSEGLLLFTNDGEFANQVMHPKFHINKAYRVTVRPDVTDKQAMQLAEGVMVDGVRTAPAQVTVLTKEPGRVVMQIVITEGRNRQIRKMCEAVGLEVARLKRTSIGPVRLGMLQPGEWRELTEPELNALGSSIRSAQQQAAANSNKAKASKPRGSWGSGNNRAEKKPADKRTYKKVK
ncbi:pseudouridine synthase [Hydrogenoanaerobacterium sp.]|uniref:pseudouridine synthase n=1 Tax=Hydrogenoanaerobacterium sp. TaxID=2953763 RepID=UPI0028A1EBBC|nr:pseudouridine synthase [Hydrogenoanaerobacterium sp.]